VCCAWIASYIPQLDLVLTTTDRLSTPFNRTFRAIFVGKLTSLSAATWQKYDSNRWYSIWIRITQICSQDDVMLRRANVQKPWISQNYSILKCNTTSVMPLTGEVESWQTTCISRQRRCFLFVDVLASGNDAIVVSCCCCCCHGRLWTTQRCYSSQLRSNRLLLLYSS